MYLGRGFAGRADFGFVANSVTKDGLGKHVDRDQFEENELSMLSELYSDGALQMSRDLRRRHVLTLVDLV